jgi:hypothetical protein
MTGTMNRNAQLVRTALAVAILSACGGTEPSAPTSGLRPTHADTRPAIEHVITYGQSASLGERSVADFEHGDLAINAPTVDALMFAGGVRPLSHTADTTLAYGALVPFREDNDASNAAQTALYNIATPGETVLTGVFMRLPDGPDYVGSASGRGGTAIANLGPGSVPYARMLSEARHAKALASSYHVKAVIWMQGEDDFGNVNYAAELRALIADMRADIGAISGQQTVQIYICPTLTPGVSSAQVQVAADTPDVFIGCATTTLPRSDGAHLTEAGSRIAGEQIGDSINAHAN